MGNWKIENAHEKGACIITSLTDHPAEKDLWTPGSGYFTILGTPGRADAWIGLVFTRGPSTRSWHLFHSLGGGWEP